MADVRCPMCGKPNPADAETCRYCQARLKPLNISPFGSSEDSEVPDWLRGLRGPEGSEGESSETGDFSLEAEDAQQGEVPDWLSRLGGEQKAPGGEAQGGEPKPAGDRDWLAGLGGIEQGQPGEGESQEGSLPPAFSLGEEKPGAPAGGAEPAESGAGSDLSSWLDSLKSEEKPAEQPPAAAEWSAGSLPSAFSIDEEPVVPAGEAEPASSAAGDDLANWLASIKGEEPAAEQQPAAPFGEAEPAATGWGAEPAGAESAGAEPAGELPDWLAGLKGATEAGVEGPPAQEPAAPDWLSGSGQASAFSSGEEEPAAPAWGAEPAGVEPAGAEPGGALPDWLAGLKGVTETGAEGQAGQEPAVPDWLRSGSQTPAFSFGEGEPAMPEATGETPDWLAGLSGGQPPVQEPPAAAPAGAEPGSELPDWLASLTGGEQPAAEAPGAAPFAVEEPAGAVEPAEPAEGLPDWLSQVGQMGQAPVSEGGAQPGASVPAFTMDEGMEGVDFAAQPPSEEAAELAMQVPDWISQVTPEMAPEVHVPSSEPEQPSGLAQAELPAWLDAMRPVEALAPESVFRDTSDDRLENAGPLAGMRGVIPAEAGVLQLRRPAAYALKIPLAEDQQARLKVLQDLLAGESQAVQLPTKAAVSSQLVLRLVVFLLLVLASVAALWSGSITPLPAADQVAPEVLAVRQQVDALGQGAPVLLVMDFEAGFVDEMSSVVMPVLDHLASRGAYITVVSTSPTGPVIAASLLDWLNRQTAYAQNPYTNFTNLGYLPGGTNGIQAFVSAPAQTLPRDLSGDLAWTGAPLDAEKGLSSFALVVVASDDAESARQWVEQAGPQLLGKTPMVALTSAQAGPILQAYYATQPRMVSGVVSGVVGGAAYHSLTSRPGVAQFYWDAFSLAMNVMIVFIVLGGFFFLFSAMLPQRKTQKGEGKA